MLGGLTLSQAASALFVFPSFSQAVQHALAPNPIHDPYSPQAIATQLG